MFSIFGGDGDNKLPQREVIDAVLIRDLALYSLLPPRDREELLRFVPDFLKGKTFYGCNGHQVNDEQRILVAAQAALTGRNQPVGFFRSTRWVLLYPDLVDLDGQAFDTSKVVLAWDQVLAESRDIHFCQNLCVHEFTHVMDHQLGLSGGTAALRAGLEALQQQLQAGEETLLDETAADGPEEFLAAVGEAFFTAPVELAAVYPDLYPELVALYGIDMGELLGPWPSDDDQDADGSAR